MTYPIKIEKTKNSRLPEVDLERVPFGKVFTDHMFVVDYVNGKWINAEIKPTQALPMHPANLTLHYGQAIFEGMKATKDINGQPVLFRPELNARRLNFSARRMCMAELPEALFLEALNTLIDLDSDWIPQGEEGALYIRPYMYALDSFIGVSPSESYRFVIMLLPVGPYYSTPVKLWVERVFARAVKGGTGEAKAAGNYAASLYPAKLARQKGYDQLLWTDAIHHKWIEESGTMNVFFVIDELVVTPSLEGSILQGITRDSVITLLRDKGYEVQERPVSIDELILAYQKGILKEGFGVGTAVVVIPFQSITDGDLTMELHPESFQIAPMLKAEINGIKKGLLPDKHDWVKRVQADEAVAAH
ncbi:MAG: branched-chain amino acid aminotransferase [Saprospiraceae bacterium]|nr:branched-chain amino acid aminotransferase [Saprospiraceae bacterium]